MRLFRFRLGVLVGGVIGYVLGAKAGRQRYDQIASLARSASQSRPAQQLNAEMRAATERAKDVIGAKATEGVARMTDVVREKVPGGTEHTAPTNGRVEPADPARPE